MHRQTLNAFSELEATGLGLNEVKQLWLTILEIAEANNIPGDQAVPKFLKDVEEQYSSKFGFENKVSEKRRELFRLNDEIKRKLLMLQWNNGTHFGPDFKSSDNKDNEPKEGPGLGQSLTDELKIYGGIKIAIKEISEELHRMRQEIDESNKQKQEVLAYCQLAIYLTNIINNKVSSLRGLMDHHLNGQAHTKINPAISTHLLIFVIYDKSNNKEKEGEGEGEGNKIQIMSSKRYRLLRILAIQNPKKSTLSC